MTRLLPFAALALLTALSLPADAQSIWKWRDANGTLQISDQPPPPSVAEKDILSRPGRRSTAGPAIVDAAASAPAAAPSAPRRDAELEARQRKQQEAREAAAAQAAKEREQARRAELCRQAKNQLTMLESGYRIARPNAKGEPEFLDDATRAAESRTARDQVASQCN